MERDLRGNLTRETGSKTQASDLLILKSPPEKKTDLLSSPNPGLKKIIMKQVTLILIEH